MVCVLDDKYLAVNGKDRSLDIVSPTDMSVMYNLNTDGQMPFVVIKHENLVWAGCNQGHLFNWKVDRGFQERHLVRVQQKISQMVVF